MNNTQSNYLSLFELNQKVKRQSTTIKVMIAASIVMGIAVTACVFIIFTQVIRPYEIDEAKEILDKRWKSKQSEITGMIIKGMENQKTITDKADSILVRQTEINLQQYTINEMVIGSLKSIQKFHNDGRH